MGLSAKQAGDAARTKAQDAYLDMLTTLTPKKMDAEAAKWAELTWPELIDEQGNPTKLMGWPLIQAYYNEL